ncbi:MAG: 4-hydroxy-tetrahydrodipicolinate synthase, partial [Verrucomicrobia bacterium GWC2_42_7]
MKPQPSLNVSLFHGVHTALVTPFYNEKICYESLEKLVNQQIEDGINGLVAVGTTGESPTLDYEEQDAVIRFVIEKAQKRVPIIAGTGTNCTQTSIKRTMQADKLGVDAMLVVAPYYNKPSQEGLFIHFSRIAECTQKPIILYSIPSRCGIEIGVHTLAKLHAKYPHIIGVKESGGSCNRVSQIIKEVGDSFLVLSGDDSLTLPFLALGAKGVISVASNLVVKPLVKMVKHALDNDLESASEINKKYYFLFKNLFIEPNPVPIKKALFMRKIIPSAEVRLPLCEMSPSNLHILEETLKSI